MDFLQLYTHDIVRVLAILTIIGQLIAALLTLVLLKEWITHSHGKISAWFSRHGLVLMLIVALLATIGSLFLSEIAGWVPCKDCWLQRIFMYPQVILLIIALWKKDRSVARYIVGLGIFGAAIATYHYFIQMQNIIASPTNPATPCDETGVSCVVTPFVEFGYITIPLMSLTAFILTMVCSVAIMRSRK